MKKLLPFKVRPFNMANYSGGSGYLSVIFELYILPCACIVNLISLILLTLISRIKAKDRGYVKINSINKFFKRVYLWISLVITIGLTVFLFDWGGVYTSAILLSFFASLITGAMPCAVFFLSVSTAVKILEKTGKTVVDEESREKKLKAVLLFFIALGMMIVYSVVSLMIVLLLCSLLDRF